MNNSETFCLSYNCKLEESNIGLVFFFSLLYLFSLHPDYSFPPSSPHSPSPHLLPTLGTTPPPAYQVLSGLSTSSPAEARQGSHDDWRAHLLPMSRGLSPAHVCTLVGDSVSECYRDPGWLTLLAFLWSSHLLQGPQSFPRLFHKSPRPLSKVWLWVSASVSVSC